MTRLRRMVVAMVLGSLAGAIALVFFYALKPAIVLDMDRELPAIARGFYPVEEGPYGLTFAWTGAQAEIALPGIDRRAAWVATVRLRGGRSDPTALPEVRLAVDGTVLATHRAANAFTEMSVEVPARATERGTVLTLLVSSTFVPGRGDARALGVMVDQVRVAPASDTVALVPRRTLGGAMIACGLFGLAFGAIGLTSVPAVGAAVLVAIGQGAAIVRGTGPYLPYGGNMAWFAFGIVVLLVGGTLAIERVQGLAFRNTARFVAAFAASALYLKLLVLLHPSLPLGEAAAQAHRLEWVLGGRYLFTSMTPGGFELPDAVGLYIFALPFTVFGHGVPFLVELLRVVVAMADTLTGLLVYLVIARSSGDRVAGAMAAGIFHLVPIDTAVQAAGDLTNAFGQSLSLAALALVALGFVGRGLTRGMALTTAVALAAALSHISTFAILVPVLLAIAAGFKWGGHAHVRASAVSVAGVAAVVAALAVVVYYGHFLETYRSQIARLLGEVGHTAAGSGLRGHTVVGRLASVPHDLRMSFGIPAIVLAAAGAIWVWRRRQPDRLALTLGGWAAGCAAFLVLGVLTPVNVRNDLAFFPAVAMLSGIGASWLWRMGPLARAVSVGLLAWVVGLGVWQWLLPLTDLAARNGR